MTVALQRVNMPGICTVTDCTRRITGRPVDTESTLCDQCQQQQTETMPTSACDTCKGTRYIESELLMYVHDKFNASSATMMKRALVSHFNDNEVREAKDILWQVYDENLLGKIQKRNHQPDKPSARREKEIDDIFGGFVIIDRNNAWKDNVKFCATKSDRIPKYSPEDANIGSVLDRIMALEMELTQVKEQSSMHTGQIRNISADVASLKIDRSAEVTDGIARQLAQQPTMGASWSGILQTKQIPKLSELQQQLPLPAPPSLFNTKGGRVSASQAAPNITDTAPPTGTGGETITVTATTPVASPITPGATPKADASSSNKQGSTPRQAPQVKAAVGSGKKKVGQNIQNNHASGGIHKHNSKRPVTSDMLQKALTELPEGFNYPPKYKKKLGVIGNKDVRGVNVRGAPKCKIMFVHHVSNDTDDDALKVYIEQNVVPVQSFERSSNPASSAKSYRIKVLVDDAKKMLDANLWPSGIGCSFWKFKKSHSTG